MKLGVVNLERCIGNEVVATDVYNQKGVMLVTKGTILNDYIVKKLNKIGIQEIEICEDFTLREIGNKDLFTQNYGLMVQTLKNMIHGLLNGESLAVTQLNDITDFIYQGGKASEEVIRFLDQIHTADDCLYDHSIRVSFYAMLLGKWISLPKKDIVNLIHAGLLHDIGKIRIPNQILNKPDTLTSSEFEIIKKHTLLGKRMLNNIPTLDESIKECAFKHHERLDGTGYPNQLKGDEISLYTRIISIVDVYDAMTSDRVYRDKLSPFLAFHMFLNEGLCGFDIALINKFVMNMSKYYIGSSVILSNGWMGEIVYIPPQNVSYPIIHVDDCYIDLGKYRSLEIVQII